MAKIIFILVILILGFFIYQNFFTKKDLDIVRVNIKSKTYQLEVARTMAQQTRGLMNREKLCSRCGMIFPYPVAMPLSFWMKNTLIPLDIIFIDASGKVINIAHAVPQPGVSDFSLKKYSSTSPAKYVIELNAGDSEKLGLVPGDFIDLKKI